MNVRKFIELSRWFNRKSQHYVLGDWTTYATNYRELFNYYRRYPVAYIKFMWLCRSEY